MDRIRFYTPVVEREIMFNSDDEFLQMGFNKN